MDKIIDKIFKFLTAKCYKEGLFVRNVESAELFVKLKITENWPSFEYYKQENWAKIVFELIYLLLYLSIRKNESVENIAQLPFQTLIRLRNKEMNTEWILDQTINADDYNKCVASRIHIYSDYGTEIPSLIDELFNFCNFSTNTKNKYHDYFVTEFKEFYIN